MTNHMPENISTLLSSHILPTLVKCSVSGDIDIG